MRIPAHIRLSRHGIYYFRIVVPRPLRQAFDRRAEFKVSLRTRNQRIALVQARSLAIRAYIAFSKVRAHMAARRPPYDPEKFNSSDPATWPVSKESLRDWEAIHEIPTPHGVEVFTIKADPEKPGDVESAKAYAAEETAKLRALRAPLSPERLAAIATADAAVAAEIDAGMARRPLPPAAPPVAAVDTPSRRRGADHTDKMLSSLFKRFVLHKKKSSLKTMRSEKTYRMKFDVFLDWFGDTHIEDVLPEDISSYKDYLLAEIEVRAGRKKGQKGLDAPTVDNYVGVINGLYVWARQNGHFPRQMLPPTLEQRMMTKKDKKARAQSGKVNRAFKTEELIKAFDAKAYRSGNRLSHHFWPPLIALHTGMRLGEVSQLACSDILKEEGIWAISINDEDYKNVKSAAARRTIRSHSHRARVAVTKINLQSTIGISYVRIIEIDLNLQGSASCNSCLHNAYSLNFLSEQIIAESRGEQKREQ